MIHSSDSEPCADLARLGQLVRETDLQVRRVHARAHRLCGFLAERGSESPAGPQEDGWYPAN
jgi:hypothetical protein